jgi:hypothetical protein
MILCCAPESVVASGAKPTAAVLIPGPASAIFLILSFIVCFDVIAQAPQ